MAHQNQRTRTTSRLKGSVRAITTKLCNLPIKNAHTARPKPIIEETTLQLRVLPPSTPPSPPPGSLIAAENWSELAACRQRSQHTHSPCGRIHNVPAKYNPISGVKLGCIVEDDSDDESDSSCGSALDSDSTGVESDYTDATSQMSLPEEEGDILVKDITGEQDGGVGPDYPPANNPTSDTEHLNGETRATQNEEMEAR
ncbi:hypothetical protein VM1G_02455 [Cytospora mali]|uniref:Uncharacterized protein n=1 Tax=Cytospora mali TaxID=578113 RepID=A0A194VRX0_CYTMA|nr:hypothetical protein VM1G_02455 [Valsa mali]